MAFITAVGLISCMKYYVTSKIGCISEGSMTNVTAVECISCVNIQVPFKVAIP
jgi:hypothetical protein